MRQSEARTLVEHVLVALTRYRGIAAEQLGPDMLDVAKQVEAWTLGSKNPLPACEKMLEQEPMEPMAFYNLMYLAHNIAPELAMAVGVFQKVDLPKPDILWVRGWDPEEAV
jgi:hypothetical protein